MPIILRLCVAIQLPTDAERTPSLAPSTEPTPTSSVAPYHHKISGRNTTLPEEPSSVSKSKSVRGSIWSPRKILRGIFKSRSRHHHHDPSPADDELEQRRGLHIPPSASSIRSSKASERFHSERTAVMAESPVSPPTGQFVSLRAHQSHHVPSPNSTSSTHQKAPAVSSASPGPPTPSWSSPHLFVWLSMRVTPRTTVKMVLHEVRRVVERRFGGRLCVIDSEDDMTQSNLCGEIGGATHLPAAPEVGSGGKSTVGCHTTSKGCDAHRPLSEVPSTGEDTVPGAVLSLCLQDADGCYRWVGSSHRFAHSILLQAPFVVDVCLKNAAAAAEQRGPPPCVNVGLRGRQQQEEEGTGGGGLSRQPLQPPPASDADAVKRSRIFIKALPPSAMPTSSVNSWQRPSEGCGGGAAAESLRIPTAIHGERSAVMRGAPPETSTTTSAAPAACTVDASTAKQDETMELPFTFLRGVVLPLAVFSGSNKVLREGPSTYYPSGGTPPQYAVVQLPNDMLVEPLDTANAPVASEESSCEVEDPPVPVPSLRAVNPSAGAVSPLLDLRSSSTAADYRTNSQDASTGLRSRSRAAAAVSTGPAVAEGGARSVLAGEAAVAPSSPSFASTRSLPNRETSLLEAPAIAAADTVPDVEGSLQSGPHRRDEAAKRRGEGGRTGSRQQAREPTGATAQRSAMDACADHGGMEVNLSSEERSSHQELVAARRAYTAALGEYRSVVPPSPEGEAGIGDGTTPPPFGLSGASEAFPGEYIADEAPSRIADEELAALVKRKLELQRSVEACHRAERHCERLAALTERLEEELRNNVVGS